MTENEPTNDGDLANAVNMIYNARRVSLTANGDGKIISAKLQYLKSVKVSASGIKEEWEDCTDDGTLQFYYPASRIWKDDSQS